MVGIRTYKSYFETSVSLLNTSEVKALHKYLKNIGRDEYLSQVHTLINKYKYDHIAFFPPNTLEYYTVRMDAHEKMVVAYSLAQYSKMMYCLSKFLKNKPNIPNPHLSNAFASLTPFEQFLVEYGNPYTKWFWSDICPSPFEY